MREERANMALGTKATIGIAAGIGVALLAFFMLVDLTQRQTVNAMFILLGIAAAFWFWKKPWR